MLERPPGIDGDRVRGHYFRHRRLLRIQAAGEYAHQGIALGKDADQPPFPYHGQGADLFVRHQLRRVAH
jgi:hypothetical protein